MFIDDARVEKVEAEQCNDKTGNVAMTVSFYFSVPAEQATSLLAALSAKAKSQTLEIGNLPASLSDI